jgi:hypothetical protein
VCHTCTLWLDAALFTDQDMQYVYKAASNVDDAMSRIELGFEHVFGGGYVSLEVFLVSVVVWDYLF